MIKLSKYNYDRLLLQADQLKYQGNKKLSSLILNMIGPLSKEASEDAAKTVVSDLRESLKSDLFESMSKSLDILNKPIDADKLDDLCEFYCEKILKDLIK